VSQQEFETIAGLLGRRHSCRSFLDRPVPEEVLERLFETARRTASWCNVQPWQVILLSGDATDRFRDGLQAHIRDNPAAPDIAFPPKYEGAHAARRRASGLALYESVGIAAGDRAASARQGAENFRMFGAPHVAIVTTPVALGTYGAVDCGAFVGTVLLLAESLGLGAIAQAALAAHAPFVRSHLGIAEGRQVLCGISLGYEDKAHPANGLRTTRADLSEILERRA